MLDLRGVTHLDSTGMRLLMKWHQRSADDGIVFAVIPGPPVVQRALEAAGLADRLTHM